jgi:outer membrane receptor for ferrienterochelin and colicin
MEALQLHGEVEYTMGEQFSASASLNFNQFTKLQKEKKAWGMIPLELNAGLRWQLLKDLWLHADLWAWDGAQYRGKTGDSFKGDGGFDLNTGAEFRITKNFNLWIQLNNILNNRYERWHQYESFGFNVLGGVTYSFNQK